MKSVQSEAQSYPNFFSLNDFSVPKESRHGIHKDPFYHLKYYQKNKEDIKTRRRKRYWEKERKLKPQPSLSECLKKWKYQNWFKFFASPEIRKFGHKKDGSDVKKCSCVKTYDAKGFLKVIHTWHLNRKEKRYWSKYIQFNQMGIALGVKPQYSEYRFGCLDIDCPKYTGLFPRTMYVSNRIGSVHFYFLYKENDLGKENTKIAIKDFKADFKMCQYMMSPLSKHHSDRLYLLKGIGRFFIGKFDKASEAYNLVIKRVKQLQAYRQWRQEQKQLKCQIVQHQIPYEKK